MDQKTKEKILDLCTDSKNIMKSYKESLISRDDINAIAYLEIIKNINNTLDLLKKKIESL